MTPIGANSLVSAMALLLNIPFGSKRANYPKLSPAWFFWLHVSIPLIILLRYLLGTSLWMIPANIILAVLGQLLGARIRQRSNAQR